jgi:hypothetical protein
MAFVLIIYSVVLVWTAGLPDWIVAYATGLAQLGVWVSLFSLIPFCALWISSKQNLFVEMDVNRSGTHWATTLKALFLYYYFIF